MAAIIIITELYFFSSLEKYVCVCLFHPWKRETVSQICEASLELDAKLNRAQIESWDRVGT